LARAITVIYSLLAFSCVFWAAGLAIFTLGVWAQISLADYMMLSANRYPNAPLILLSTGAAVTAWGFLGCLGVAANLPCVLRAYGFFQLAALVAGLAAGLSGLFYREDIAGGFRSGLQRAVAGYTEDEGRADALDSLQRALECCGHMTFLPFENGTSVSLPDSCCVRRKGCRNRIHPHGCFRKVFSLVNDNVFHIAATVLGCFILKRHLSFFCLDTLDLRRADEGRKGIWFIRSPLKTHTNVALIYGWGGQMRPLYVSLCPFVILPTAMAVQPTSEYSSQL
uniref:Uncharacterized protein n=1 Tax=Oryzias latipes TaxID=8090 RepID=A0A3P9HQV5_ORYLA